MSTKQALLQGIDLTQANLTMRYPDMSSTQHVEYEHLSGAQLRGAIVAVLMERRYIDPDEAGVEGTYQGTGVPATLGYLMERFPNNNRNEVQLALKKEPLILSTTRKKAMNLRPPHHVKATPFREGILDQGRSVYYVKTDILDVEYKYAQLLSKAAQHQALDRQIEALQTKKRRIGYTTNRNE